MSDVREAAERVKQGPAVATAADFALLAHEYLSAETKLAEANDNANYYRREIIRMGDVMRQEGIWDQFCAAYAKRFPLNVIPTTESDS